MDISMHSVLYTALAHYPFVWQLALGEFLFAQGYRRRGRFAGRAVLALLGQTLFAFPLLWLYAGSARQGLVPDMLWRIALYGGLFLLSLGGLAFCYAETLQDLLLCAVTGYAVQHSCSQVALLLWDHCFSAVTENHIRFRLAELAVYAVGCGLIYLLVARRANQLPQSAMQRKNVLFLSVAALAVLLVLSSARDYYQTESLALTTITRLFSIICCVFLLLLRTGFLEKSQLEQEMDTLRRLHHKEREQYEQRRETIDLINIKCHDLKRRLAEYEQRPAALTAQELAELRRTVSIYDTTVKTGNETLDTILTERSLVCEKEGIAFSCMADGAGLGFLSVGDTYSLFGNAVDNAIEAVRALPDPDDRRISLTVRRRGGLLVIAMDNPCAGALTFADGLPVTTKADSRYHGYGMKSIRMIVEKYGGEMTVTADEWFRLAILLPLPADAAADAPKE